MTQFLNDDKRLSHVCAFESTSRISKCYLLEIINSSFEYRINRVTRVHILIASSRAYRRAYLLRNAVQRNIGERFCAGSDSGSGSRSLTPPPFAVCLTPLVAAVR